MKLIKRWFTMWYIKRGYTFGYDFSGIPVHCDEVVKIPGGIPKAIYNCPWWVKPLLIFFSPSVYYMKTFGELLAKGFAEGLKTLPNKVSDGLTEHNISR